jgi:propionyl-CoA carboxylase alpha chain
MIAKLVTHAPSRAEAIEAQAEALDAFAIEGIRHNIPFLSALMQHPRWREGRLSTGLHRRGVSARVHAAVPKGEVARRLAASRRRSITS